jgi:hypothetical protein
MRIALDVRIESKETILISSTLNDLASNTPPLTEAEASVGVRIINKIPPTPAATFAASSQSSSFHVIFDFCVYL